MKIEKSSGAHTFSEHAKSLAAAQGTNICEPGWVVTKWIMQSRATIHWGHQEMPHAPAGQVSGKNEDHADIGQHPKPGDLQGEGDPAPCASRPLAAGRVVLGPSLADTHRAALQLCSHTKPMPPLYIFINHLLAHRHTEKRKALL